MRSQQLKIIPFPEMRITQYEAYQGVNDHGFAKFRAIIPSRLESVYLDRLFQQTAVQVMMVDEDQNDQIIYCGMIKTFEIQAENDVKHLSGEIVSETFLMDLHKHIRTFQESSYTYERLQQIITETYPNSNFIMREGVDRSINQLIVQYEETDWSFITRLASRINTVLVPSYTVSGIKYYFGFPEKTEPVVIQSNEYIVEKRLEELQLKIAQGISDLLEQDAIVYLWTSREYYEIGDNVILNDQSLYIETIATTKKGEEIWHRYQLKTRKLIQVPTIFNQKISGASLNGKIVSVKSDVVKITLSSDENAAQSGTRWFPYATPYSSPSGAGWYCMPEPGDKIRLSFPSSDEAGAFVSSSTHMEVPTSTESAGEGGVASLKTPPKNRNAAPPPLPPPRQDPDYKTISNKSGKTISLTPDAIVITNNEGSAIVIDDANGISIISASKITLQAVDEIILCSESGSISVDSPEKIELKQSSATITMGDDLTLSGGKVYLD